MNNKKEIARITLSSLAPDSLAQLQTMARLGLRVEAIVAEGSPTVVFVPLVAAQTSPDGLTPSEKSGLHELTIELDINTEEMERKLGVAAAKVNAFMEPIDRAIAAASAAPDVILDILTPNKPRKRTAKKTASKRARK